MNLENFLNPQGRVASTKTTEKYIRKNFPEEHQKIKTHSDSIGLNGVKFSEEIYHYLNSISSPIKCSTCSIKTTKFEGLLRGYRRYCSSKCSNGSDEVKERKKTSSIEKYGVENPAKSDEVIRKIKNTFDSKYGGNPFSVFREKIAETNLKKYGAVSPLSPESSIMREKFRELQDNFVAKYKDLEVVDYEGIKTGTCQIRCEKCLGIFTISKWNLHQRTKGMMSPCTICNPIGASTESGIEKFIENLLNQIGANYIKGDRKILEGKEIDFYLPEHNLGIEVNGLFWHSEKFKGKNYHIQKSEFAKSKGVRLIHIFEDEIMEKPGLVEGRIKSILGIYERRVFARKCEIRAVSSEDAKKFLDDNHMQGSTGAKVKLGLFFNGEIVSVMTFGGIRVSLGGKPKKNHWELIRFSNKIGISVIGGASKLLNHFKRDFSPEEIISYCDRRWSDGEFYSKIGFDLVGETRVNYWYVKNSRREGRFKYRKDILVSEGHSAEKTESQIMSERGFLKIYDCGNFKFRL